MRDLGPPGIQLGEYVRNLMQSGKTAAHPDFQALYACFGEAKIKILQQQVLDESKPVEPTPPNPEDEIP
jgi:hypothetical protein